MSYSTKLAEIAAVDRQIDQIRLALQTLEPVKIYNAASWQAAWDKHPAMRAQEEALFRHRGILQRERDQAAHEAAMRRSVRVARLKKCPTCKQRTLAA